MVFKSMDKYIRMPNSLLDGIFTKFINRSTFKSFNLLYPVSNILINVC
jgi:hypothetical protein